MAELGAITGTDGDDLLSGSAGADTIIGLDGRDILSGAAGNDILYGNWGTDALFGGDGSDTLFGGQGNDMVTGAAGNDALYGNMANDTVYGGDGADAIFGGQGDDTLYGENGTDILYGNLGDDWINGGWDSDTLFGGAGNDTIDDSFGRDVAHGEAGDDVLYGREQADILYGDEGNDTLTFMDILGNAGHTLFGGEGDDLIRTEWLYGGNAVMHGGDGADRFEFTDSSARAAFDWWNAGQVATIADFEHGKDAIALRTLGWENVPGTLQVRGKAVTIAAGTGFSDETSSVICKADESSNSVMLYVHGVGSAYYTVKVISVTAVEASDFLFAT